MSPHPISALYRDLDTKRDRVAIHDGATVLRYGALVDLVERAAAALLRQVAPGARIGLCAENSWGNIVAYLAILRAGAVWVPINPNNGAGLNSALMARAGLALALCDDASRASLGDPGAPVIGLDGWLAGPLPAGELPAISGRPEAAFAIKFTGGSTGVPKGVVQTTRSAGAALASLEAFYRFGPEDVHLAVAPLSHGASHYILPVLAAGAAHVVLARPDRSAILAELKRRVSVVFLPPTLIRMLMDEADFGPADFPALRHITYSAAPMAPAVIEEAISRFGPVLSTLYGQTEAPMAITGLTPDQLARPELRATVGFPFPGIDVAVLTEAGEIVARKVTGEVLVRGDLTETFYLDAPDLTAEARFKGWLRTGDIGRIGADGALAIVGRAKEMIITGGYNVYFAEVEQALVAHPGVREACAFGVEDPVWGERLEVAVVTGAPVEELHAFMRERVGPVRTPKQFHRVAGLPRNPVGKVVRTDVRTLVSQEQA
ncbi:AMP-binding protein [Stappia taiwanensis]|uniref:AMP-binding protein n=1 Tax=Stappia taiwanensis TaxID=992267 RepID=A0A838Y2Z2_9HYPH|nr:AMP-binding protein [Stappia taiwanensis]MBA4613554.1 AMP-binding protein [Stappia taiwanensis]GGE96688.1 AMP-dependent acyl-CoA synthetase [Stappia taiwanensis]